ncbi:hypothetical protein [Flexithrix dorotheae]|uniref:hypothetical protein n=1 Tax=Flexithrix dorotheae TaxID=70993 RepID=UPI0003804D3A|nr:hypothetical protein [Flexithrix dorotheae]
MFEPDDIMAFAEITGILKSYLMPYALIFILIAVALHAYNELVEKENQEMSYSGSDIFFGILRKLVFPILVFFTFDTLCLVPIFFISEIETRLREVDVVQQMYTGELNQWERLLKDNNYLNEKNEAHWNEASFQTKMSVIRIVKNEAEIIEKLSPNLHEEVDIALGIEKDNSTFSLMGGLSLSEFIHHGLVFLINMLRQGIEYLFGLIFKMLLYLDIIIGQFVAMFAILPMFRSNILRWVQENISLCLWAIVFLIVDWILGYISFRASLSADASVADWVIPLLSIITYGAIGSFAGKIIGREASGVGMLQTASKTALSAIPAVGAFVGGAFGILTTSQASGKLKDKFGKWMPATAQTTSKIFKGAKNAVDFFKPQKKPTAMERMADDIAILRKTLTE